MILAVNIGNSHISFGCMEEERVVCRFQIATDLQKTADEYTCLIKQLLSLYQIEQTAFSGAVLACVVPPLSDVMAGALHRLVGRRPLVVGAGVKTGLNIKIENPAQLGVDLAALAVGALHLYGAPATVVSLGTATTFVVLDREKNLIGVTIAPGIGLSLSALAAGASLLPDVQVAMPNSCFGTNTVDSMRAGAVFGTAAMIEGLLTRFEEALGYPATAIATGNLAALVLPACKKEVIVDEDLLFVGLACIYAKNRRKSHDTLVQKEDTCQEETK